MIIIGIETSCDETSIGIVEDGKKILSNIIFSQIKYHKKFSGVVPEIASRLHLQVINNIFQEALDKAGIKINDIDAIAVVNQPGLVGSLMVGVSFAKTLALFLKKPIIGINHLLAHLYANFLTDNPPEFPSIGLLISGGHTMILKVNSFFDYKIIGTTLDDAVGEAYDKVAKLLKLGYPGGPIIDKIANEYDGDDYVKFPLGLINDKQNKYNFSYSGLKTAVLNYVKKNENFDYRKVAKGFQIAAIQVLFEKTLTLANETGINQIGIAGGVAANSYLRKLFLQEKSLKVHIPDIELCTDNGAMVAGYAFQKAKKNQFDDLRMDVYSKPKGGPLKYINFGIPD